MNGPYRRRKTFPDDEIHTLRDFFVISIMLIMRVGRLIDENFEQIFNLYNSTVYEVSMYSRRIFTEWIERDFFIFNCNRVV